LAVLGDEFAPIVRERPELPTERYSDVGGTLKHVNVPANSLDLSRTSIRRSLFSPKHLSPKFFKLATQFAQLIFAIACACRFPGGTLLSDLNRPIGPVSFNFETFNLFGCLGGQALGVFLALAA
jgi:hypothetical protein